MINCPQNLYRDVISKIDRNATVFPATASWKGRPWRTDTFPRRWKPRESLRARRYWPVGVRLPTASNGAAAPMESRNDVTSVTKQDFIGRHCLLASLVLFSQ
eukprot:scaffold1596_cov302-Pinguiococcus_pyrenoidosus.AAC.70